MGTKTYTVLVGLMCVALSACSSMDNGSASNDMGGAYGASASTTSDTANSSSNAMAADNSAQTQAMTAYGVVQAIDTIPRSQASGMSGQSGSSGTAGTSSSDTMYRITMRLDDGSIKAVTQDAQPSLQIGDRIRLSNGMVQRY